MPRASKKTSTKHAPKPSASGPRVRGRLLKTSGPKAPATTTRPPSRTTSTMRRTFPRPFLRERQRHVATPRHGPTRGWTNAHSAILHPYCTGLPSFASSSSCAPSALGPSSSKRFGMATQVSGSGRLRSWASHPCRHGRRRHELRRQVPVPRSPLGCQVRRRLPARRRSLLLC